MEKRPEKPPGLTKNQTLVMEVLNSAVGPLRAYAILDQLRGKGFRAPLQVYRALDKLSDRGMVHRIESINAFIACRHLSNKSHGTVAFTICDTCGEVAEIFDGAFHEGLNNLAETIGFTQKKSTVELIGHCKHCG
mgnify:CR=1 FL=1